MIPKLNIKNPPSRVARNGGKWRRVEVLGIGVSNCGLRCVFALKPTQESGTEPPNLDLFVWRVSVGPINQIAGTGTRDGRIPPFAP